MSPPSNPITLAAPLEPTDHSQGSEHARISVVEYGDFECPSCKVAATTPKLLLERYPNKIRFVFRHADGGGGRGSRRGAGKVLAHVRRIISKSSPSEG